MNLFISQSSGQGQALAAEEQRSCSIGSSLGKAIYDIIYAALVLPKVACLWSADSAVWLSGTNDTKGPERMILRARYRCWATWHSGQPPRSSFRSHQRRCECTAILLMRV